MARLGRKYAKLPRNPGNRPPQEDSSSVPASPPPSFRSTASYMPIQPDDPLARSFDIPGEDEAGAEDDFFFRRENEARPEPTQPASSSSVAAPANSNDGVFANITAKPEVAREKPADENPPSYEEAAADATPPYWETTILAPGMASDEIYIDGLPVGNFFNFVWNMLISMSFQFIGFLLTYLLHTTHAAKNGSRAGLGITLIQYGFYLRSAPEDDGVGSGVDAATVAANAQSDPNSYFVSNDTESSGDSSDDAMTGSEWFSYFLMLLGWFILIKSLHNFFRVRRMEQVILRAPSTSPAPAAVPEEVV